jgi:glycosyltransferase involved in cell wall biosynthesis
VKYHADYMKVLSRIDMIIAVSNFSAEQLSRFLQSHRLRLPPVQVCTYPGEAMGQSRPPPKSADSSEPVHILCISTLEPRKNHETLLKAFEQAARVIPRPLFLHLAGSRYKDAQHIVDMVERTMTLNPNVIWHGNIDAHALAHLYDKCNFTVYPSVLEGFGLPIVQSVWRRRPCICANFGAMAETAAGGGCLTVDVRDPSKLADAIVQLATRSETRQRLVDEIERRHVKTWLEYTNEIAEVLDAADG